MQLCVEDIWFLAKKKWQQSEILLEYISTALIIFFTFCHCIYIVIQFIKIEHGYRKYFLKVIRSCIFLFYMFIYPIPFHVEVAL